MRSASSMMRVLQFGTSTPVSMMVVHTRMSTSWSISCCHTRESCSSVILPWAMVMRASGAISCTLWAQASMLSTRLCR